MVSGRSDAHAYESVVYVIFQPPREMGRYSVQPSIARVRLTPWQPMVASGYTHNYPLCRKTYHAGTFGPHTLVMVRPLWAARPPLAQILPSPAMRPRPAGVD
jgi:hypothetical protein